jgi:hypothetical protein
MTALGTFELDPFWDLAGVGAMKAASLLLATPAASKAPALPS